jgi:hypothetical protein
MRWLAARLLALCLLAAPAYGATSDLPIETLLPLLADLAARGSYGVHYAERGAFLVQEEDGGIRCVLWPFTGEFHRISHAARIPRGTIAIAHTHPRCCREASGHDQREAVRLGIPIIAVSMGTLHVVDAWGDAGRPRRGIRWSQHATGAERCTAREE